MKILGVSFDTCQRVIVARWLFPIGVYMQSSALVAEDTAISAINCSFGSSHYLGVVLTNADTRRQEEHQDVYLQLNNTPRVHFRDCTFEDNFWGGFFGKDLSADAERALRAANTFRDTSIEDVSRMYESTGYDVQPWRRGWTNMQI